MQADVTGVGCLQLGEAVAQVDGGVGNVFHDVRGEPHFFDSETFVFGEYGKCFVHRLHAVVHAGQYVAVPVGESFEESAFGQCLFFTEGPHFFQLSIINIKLIA